MYYAKIDGRVCYLNHSSLEYLKKLVDIDIECGSCYAVIYRKGKEYCSRYYNTEWKRA